jgi:release factor glutamine methyltransferase
MNISQALTHYAEKLFPAYHNKQTAVSVTWWLLQKATGKTRTEMLLAKIVSPEVDQKMQGWIQAILHDHMPVQYIIGNVPFLELDISVKQPILIPRPETEYWTQLAINELKSAQAHEFYALDLCSGTGCIGLSVAHAFAEAQVIASDINPAACELIKANILKNKIKNCTPVLSDLFESLPPSQKYSVITANPPYIPLHEWQALEPRVKLWESPQALIAQQEGLHLIQEIINQAPDYLEKKIAGVAQVWIEIGFNQAEKVVALFNKAGYKEIKVVQDLYGKNRVVTGSL